MSWQRTTPRPPPLIAALAGPTVRYSGVMTTPAGSTLDVVLNGLLDRYKAHVPDVDAVVGAFESTYTAQAGRRE